MIKYSKSLVAALIAISSALTYAKPGDKIPDRYIVELKAGVGPQAVANAHGAAADVVFSRTVNGFSGIVPAGRLNALTRDGRVIAVTPDREVAANPRGGNGGGKPDKPGGEDPPPPPPRESEVTPSGITRIGAPAANLYATGAGVGIAVVDTGCDFNHPDLRLGNISFKATRKGRRITTSEGPTVGQDDEGHGTHVAGITSAKVDDFDVVGVAPDATVYAVKVLNAQGSGSDTTVIAGLEWVAANALSVDPPIRVVNMSLGRPGSLNDNPTYRFAIQGLNALGITVVVAAGNDEGSEVSGQIPAAYSEVIAVASTSALTGTTDTPGLFVPADAASFFTTDGVGVAISAPGVKQENVAYPYVNAIGILSTKLGGGTERLFGTSMASPHVAGVAALLYESLASQTFPTPATPALIRASIVGGASRVGTAPLDSPTTSYTFDLVREGVLHAAAALDAAAALAP